MHKRVLVVAVAAALVVPGVCAAESDADSVVELYGKVYPELLRPHGKGATEAGSPVATLAGTPTGENSVISRTEMDSSNSRLGFRGHERLGRDLRAIWQLETEFHVDSNDSAFAQRDSFVGLSSKGWGTVKLGRMDTPFKTFGDDLSFLGVSSGNFVSTSNVLRKTGFGTSSASSFHLRRANAVQYESPEVAGFDAALQYSTDETDTATRRPHVWSGAGEWERGGLKVSLAYEEHWDLFGGSRNSPSAISNFTDQNVRSKDKAWQAMVQYKLGRHAFEADYIQKKYDENATVTGRFASYRNNAYELIWDARWSNAWRTQVEYIKSEKGSCTRVNAACVTDGLDGSQINFGFAYYFSKRTYLFVMGALLKNGFSARYNNQDLQAPSVGEDIDTYAIGLMHSF
jgi:predicted porin